MSRREALQPCAVRGSREAADEAARVLADAGIEAVVGRPDDRTHGLAEESWQVSVPGSAAARAAAILAAADAPPAAGGDGA